MSSLLDQIEAARKRRRISRRKLSRTAGLSPSYLSTALRRGSLEPARAMSLINALAALVREEDMRRELAQAALTDLNRPNSQGKDAA